MVARYTTLLVLAAIALCAKAQNHAVLDINNIHARFYSTGGIGQDYIAGVSEFEVPAGTGTHALYAAGLWIGGIDPSGALHLAAMKYDSLGIGDYYPGPLKIDGSASISQEVSDLYDHVWKIDRADVVQHAAYFDCLATPGCEAAVSFPDYTVPDDFITWPAMGDVAAGQAVYLAPFVDRNMDGNYDPYDGDYPCIAGDQALYAIINDNLVPHLLSSGLPLGVEIHMMPFALNTGTPALDETIFVHYRITNRSNTAYHDLRIGMFHDFDLGCPDDDYLGTDPKRNLTYVLNADDFDENCLGQTGYGVKPPVLGATLIKGVLLDPNGTDDPMSSSLPALNGVGFGDQIIDNERSGIAYAKHVYRQGPIELLDPNGAQEFYNVLAGAWRDGVVQTYGGTGRSIDPDAIPARYACPGNDDPTGLGTNGQVMPPWYMSGIGVPPTDPRIVSSMHPITLDPGTTKDFLMAYVYARSPTSSPTTSVEDLQTRVDSVRIYARDHPNVFSPGSECSIPSTVGIQVPSGPSGQLAVFPSPTSDQITVRIASHGPGTSISIIDGRGRIVLVQRSTGQNATINVEGLSPGIYILQVEGNSSIRFMKE